MKFAKKVGVMVLSFMFILLILSIASAETTILNPIKDTYVNEEPGKTNANFGTSDTMDVEANGWDTQRIFIEFDFSSIPSSATIVNAVLYLWNYNNTAFPIDMKRDYSISKVNDLWGENTITWDNQPTGITYTGETKVNSSKNLWITWTVTSDVQNFVSGDLTNNGWTIKDKNEIGAYEKMFRTMEYGDENKRPSLLIEYEIPDEIPPECSINYLINKDSLNKHYFTSPIYINEGGKFYIYGDSQDDESGIFNVQYNRTSPNMYLLWTDADPVDGGFSELEEEWRSDPNDADFIDGLHTVCCRAEDNIHNVAIGECEEFCIDKDEPDQPGKPVHSNPGNCVSNYVNETPEFSWDITTDSGCANIDYYEVEVYYSDGELYYTTTTEDNSIIVGEPENGEDYYIKVRAVDKAGNDGLWSIESEHVYYDTEKPSVTINSPKQGTWFKDDFAVNETDTDPESNLWKCYYKIVNEGNITIDWTEMECNKLITIDISKYCPVDGTCTVHKNATDKACNSDKTYKWFKVDRSLPKTTKTVSEPKYPGPNILWPLVKWFVKPETTITLNCSDDGTRCNVTFYRINNGNWTEYSSPFHLGEEDGIYYLEYYSIDNINNIEDIKNETDKIDTEAPETTKTLGEPKYNARNKTWISNLTTFNLTCQDSEVGCYKRYYRVDSGAQITYSEPFTLDGYGDGMHTIYYQSIDFLQNLEQEKNEIDWLDTTAPSIQILNPTEEEAESIERCIQSIVAIVNDGEGSGIKKVWAELWTVGEGSEKVREAEMKLTIYGTYEALMDKQLPAGEYILKVYAEDNIGNLGISEMEENLKEGVFVEYIEDPICKINPETGGECDFTFHICTRNSNAVSMKMKKLAEVVTPNMMNAEISKENETAFVYLWDPAITDVDILKLSDEIINGRTSFDLHLDVPADVSSRIGKGEHKLDYLIESYSD